MKKDNLKKHVDELCFILNKNGINNEDSARLFNDGKLHVWKCGENPDATFGGVIANNSKAFNFLKQRGYIDVGICWQCGKEPIDTSYEFTSGFDPTIKFYICRSCYGAGKKLQNDFGVKNRSSNSGCYVATMCYGNINAPEVQILREYRDNVLLKKITGRLFVKFYYLVSPTFVRIFKNSNAVNNFIRERILDRIVKKITPHNTR